MKCEFIVIICTYKREKYLYNNVRQLENDLSTYLKKILIIDNGNTINKNINNNIIKVIYNKNFGGSSGFARGLYEAKKIGCTHVLLMDDDIKFMSESLIESLKETESMNGKKDWIGFSMRDMNNINKQYEQGANWNGIKISHNNKNFDLSKKRLLKQNNKGAKYNYSSWWCLVMPISIIDDYGYPMPFFIKYDDIEYGLRRKEEKIIFNDNYYVQHDSFKSKYMSYLEYYNMRNSLITNVVHFRNGLALSLIRYLLKFIYFYFRFKFKSIYFINLGVVDFIKGPNIFMDLNDYKINTKLKEKEKKKICFLKGILVYPFVFILLLIKLLFKYNAIKKQYKEKYKFLISEEFWVKRFTI